jgi:hypothetical protein
MKHRGDREERGRGEAVRLDSVNDYRNGYQSTQTDWFGFSPSVQAAVNEIQSKWTPREFRLRARWARRPATVIVATDLELDLEQLAASGRAL